MWGKQRSKSSNASKYVGRRRSIQPSQFSGQDHFMCMYNDIAIGERMMRTCDGTVQSVSHSSLKTSNRDHGCLLVLEMKDSGTEAGSVNLMENGTR